MAATKWSKRTVYEVQVQSCYSDRWTPTVNLDNAQFNSRAKAEAGMRKARKGKWLKYRVQVISTRG